MRYIVKQCPAGIHYDLTKFRTITNRIMDEIEKCNNVSIVCKMIVKKKHDHNNDDATKKFRLHCSSKLNAVRNVVFDGEKQLKNNYLIGVKIDVENMLQEDYRHNEGVG